MAELYYEVTLRYNPRRAPTRREACMRSDAVPHVLPWTVKSFRHHPVYFTGGSLYKVYRVAAELLLRLRLPRCCIPARRRRGRPRADTPNAAQGSHAAFTETFITPQPPRQPAAAPGAPPQPPPPPMAAMRWRSDEEVAVRLGLYPIVTSQYSSATLYQDYCHIR